MLVDWYVIIPILKSILDHVKPSFHLLYVLCYCSEYDLSGQLMFYVTAWSTTCPDNLSEVKEWTGSDNIMENFVNHCTVFHHPLQSFTTRHHSAFPRDPYIYNTDIDTTLIDHQTYKGIASCIQMFNYALQNKLEEIMHAEKPFPVHQPDILSCLLRWLLWPLVALGLFGPRPVRGHNSMDSCTVQCTRYYGGTFVHVIIT